MKAKTQQNQIDNQLTKLPEKTLKHDNRRLNSKNVKQFANQKYEKQKIQYEAKNIEKQEQLENIQPTQSQRQLHKSRSYAKLQKLNFSDLQNNKINYSINGENKRNNKNTTFCYDIQRKIMLVQNKKKVLGELKQLLNLKAKQIKLDLEQSKQNRKVSYFIAENCKQISNEQLKRIAKINQISHKRTKQRQGQLEYKNLALKDYHYEADSSEKPNIQCQCHRNQGQIKLLYIKNLDTLTKIEKKRKIQQENTNLAQNKNNQYYEYQKFDANKAKNKKIGAGEENYKNHKLFNNKHGQRKIKQLLPLEQSQFKFN